MEIYVANFDLQDQNTRQTTFSMSYYFQHPPIFEDLESILKGEIEFTIEGDPFAGFKKHIHDIFIQTKYDFNNHKFFEKVKDLSFTSLYLHPGINFYISKVEVIDNVLKESKV